MLIAISTPPSDGPAMPPSSHPVAQAAAARPRIAGGDPLINSDADETLNMVEPMPPAAR
jgi:hypothetical protein